MQGTTLRLTLDALAVSLFLGAPVISSQWGSNGALTVPPPALATDGYAYDDWFPGDFVSTKITCTHIMRVKAGRYPFSSNATLQAAGAYVSNTLVSRALASSATVLTAPVPVEMTTISVLTLSGSVTPVYTSQQMGLNIDMTKLPLPPIAGDVLHFTPPTPLGGGAPWMLNLPSAKCNVRVIVNGTATTLLQSPLLTFSGPSVAITIPNGIPTFAYSTTSLPRIDLNVYCSPARAPSAVTAATTSADALWRLEDSLGRTVMANAPSATTAPAVLITPLTTPTGTLIFPYQPTISGSNAAIVYAEFSLANRPDTDTVIELTVGPSFPAILPGGFTCYLDTDTMAFASIIMLNGERALRVTPDPAVGINANSVHFLRCGYFDTTAALPIAQVDGRMQTQELGAPQAVASPGVSVSGSWDPATVAVTSAVTLSPLSLGTQVEISVAILSLPFSVPKLGKIKLEFPSSDWDVSTVTTCVVTSNGTTTAATVVSTPGVAPTLVMTLGDKITAGSVLLTCPSVMTPSAYTSVSLTVTLSYSPIVMVPYTPSYSPVLMAFAVEIPEATAPTSPLTDYSFVAAITVTASNADVLTATQRSELLAAARGYLTGSLIHSVRLHKQWRVAGSTAVSLQFTVIPKYGGTMIAGSITPLLTALSAIIPTMRSAANVRFGTGTTTISEAVQVALPTTCYNVELDDTETYIDCGGASCQSCEDAVPCLAHRDCLSTSCESGYCRYPRSSATSAASPEFSANPVLVTVLAVAAATVALLWRRREGAAGKADRGHAIANADAPAVAAAAARRR